MRKSRFSEEQKVKTLRSDNGPEFVSLAVLGWLTRAGIQTAFIAPGKPWQNAPTKASTGSSATSASTWSGFEIVPKPACTSSIGVANTTRSDLTRVSPT